MGSICMFIFTDLLQYAVWLAPSPLIISSTDESEGVTLIPSGSHLDHLD